MRRPRRDLEGSGVPKVGAPGLPKSKFIDEYQKVSGRNKNRSLQAEMTLRDVKIALKAIHVPIEYLQKDNQIILRFLKES